MKIVFGSSSRYPTEKAYGVTIQETCKAASELGIQASIFTTGKSGTDRAGNFIVGTNSLLLNFLRRLTQVKNLFAGSVLFVIYCFVFGVHLAKFSKKDEPSLIWIRDPIACLALVLLLIKKPILLELHHVPKHLNEKVLRFLSNFENIYFSTLSQDHLEKIRRIVPNCKIFIVPTGVPDAFFGAVREKHKDNRVVVGYMGKAISSGNDNGLKSLIDVGLLLQANKSRGLIVLVGIEDSVMDEIAQVRDLSGLSEEYFQVFGHLQFGDVHEMLKTFEIGLVPYPPNVYNDGRFPIKILEYAATGCVIFATDSPSNRRILGNQRARYYGFGCSNELFNLIEAYIQHPENFLNQRENSREWALEFRYSNRVKRVLTEINGVS